MLTDLHVLGLVLLARNVRDAVVVHPLVGGVGVAAVARASVAAVNEGLDGRDDVSLLALGGDLDAVGDGRHGGVGPAAAAVHGDVLVQVGGQQTLGAVIKVLGEIVGEQVLVGTLGQHALAQVLVLALVVDELIVAVRRHLRHGQNQKNKAEHDIYQTEQCGGV